MARPMAAAVVGTGFIGPVHVEGLRRAGIHVTGIAGSSAEKSRAAALQWNLPRGYASFQDVLADADVDVVHLATPNHLHFPQAKAALQAGKHVLCEKPLAMHADQSAALVRLAAGSGRTAGAAYNIRFYPLCQEAASRIQGGDVGNVLHVVGSYVQDWLLYDSDFNWRVAAEQGGALRAVADIGTHWLDLAQFVTGRKVIAVCADLQTVHTQRSSPRGGAETFSEPTRSLSETQRIDVSTEDAGCVMLRFDNGARGCLWVSQTTSGRKNCLRMEVAGTEQALAWNSESPNTLWIGHRDRPNECLTRDPALLSSTAAAYASYPGGHNEGFPDTFKQLFRAFYCHAAQDTPPQHPAFPTFADGHREILICEAILKSHQQQRWTDIET